MRYLDLLDHALVVQKLDSPVQWINHYFVDNAIGFRSTYPLDSDLSGRTAGTI